jgi:hypothetical protein
VALGFEPAKIVFLAGIAFATKIVVDLNCLADTLHRFSPQSSNRRWDCRYPGPQFSAEIVI